MIEGLIPELAIRILRRYLSYLASDQMMSHKLLEGHPSASGRVFRLLLSGTIPVGKR